MIPYGRQYIDDDDIQAVIDVLKSDFLTMGPMVPRFEKAISEYTGAKFTTVVSNGTAALHVACLAAGLGIGKELITTPMTFAASANCALYCNATPKFVDIKENGLINEARIRAQVTKKTKILIPVHYAGFCCDMEEIESIACGKGLTVIEDACHALGSKYKNTSIGDCAHSDMAVFSFHPVKQITTGEGGAITTNSEVLDRKLKLLRTHGITKDHLMDEKQARGSWYHEMQALGYNYRMTDIQAALGSSQLKKIARFISTRRAIAQRYYDAFKNNEVFDTIQEPTGTTSAFHLFPILIKPKYQHLKPKIFSTLQQQGLGVQVHYIPVYRHPFYQKMGHNQGECPVAESFYEREISIPLYPAMNDEQVSVVISTMNRLIDLI
jgi:UDP-4-amino-4,6-dideoxy-N-acetyl-beta-L-altrosamine transaminase